MHQVSYVSNIFWSRWAREYLPSLQALARVLEVHSNCVDGLVHSAKVKTKMSMLVQPVDKIVLLKAAKMTSKD